MKIMKILRGGGLEPFRKFICFGTLTRLTVPKTVMTTRAFFKVCLVLIFLNAIVLKKHTLNPEITILFQIHDQKALFIVSKICNIIFWIENDPLWHFSEN